MATTTITTAGTRVERLELIWEERPGILGWLTTVDHKRIGLMFFFATLGFFGAGGVEALIIRTQLSAPDKGVVGPATYNELMTMHGTTMIFLFVIPMGVSAFGNYLVPLMVGARDLAFPRLNALSLWIFVASGLFIYVGLFIGQAPDAGWFDYVPLALKPYNPGFGIDFYALGLIFNGLSTTATAINIVTTIFKLRCPGMSLNRMPLFCYAMLASGGIILFLIPPLTIDLVMLELERKAGFHFFDPAHGGSALLWQHLFWIFGHPEVYLIVLPAFGIATSIIPTFAKRKMIAAPLVALAELLVAFIGFGVWAHHMFATGMPTSTMIFFAAASMMVVIPSTIQVYAWLFTVNLGEPRFTTPLLFIGAFIVFFVIGGLSGIMFAAIPFDQATTDTYFVVAHFHFIIFGGAFFPILGGMYYWFPKVSGRMYHERWAQVSFWVIFWGTALTFFPMHILGLLGMPRRIYTYPASMGWGAYNLAETVGAFILAAGLMLMLANLVYSRFRGPLAGPNPFGGASLEWAMPSPPPRYNFAVIPSIRSEYPMWDAQALTEDARRLELGVGVFPDGHETPESTVRDGFLDDLVEMPSESGWPIVVALCLTLLFTMLLTTHLVAAGGFAGLAALAVGAWMWKEPGE
jgi:cytochrome c oxidase subunit 1/cytochrome c oxidase subunit I+III